MRPVRALEDVSRDYPGVWQLYDTFLADRDGLGGWPDWCHCPLAGAYAAVSQKHGGTVTGDASKDIARVGALAAWRPTQSVYRFHAELLDALLDSSLDGELPVEYLYRLPEWCVYVEVGRDGTHGFFAHLEHDANTHREELRLLLDTDSGLVPLVLELTGSRTVEAAIASIVASGSARAATMGYPVAFSADTIGRATKLAKPLLSVLLYLCSGEAELRPTRNAGKTPRRPVMRPGKRGPYMPPATRPEVWETGFTLGEALRLAQESDGESGRSVRGHIRRAHWHTYLTGPRTGKQSPKLRWLPPIPVALDGAPEKPTVRNVRSDAN